MNEYRHNARSEYQAKTQKIITMVSSLHCGNNFPSCQALPRRLAALHETLTMMSISVTNNDDDRYLHDLRNTLISKWTQAHDDGQEGTAKTDKHVGTRGCRNCEQRFGDIVHDSVVDLRWGTDKHCTACFECFGAREFRFTYQCNMHRKD